MTRHDTAVSQQETNIPSQRGTSIPIGLAEWTRQSRATLVYLHTGVFDSVICEENLELTLIFNEIWDFKVEKMVEEIVVEGFFFFPWQFLYVV